MGYYQPLFTLSVEHRYFHDGLWKGLDFIPSPATTKLIQGAGLLVKPAKNGIGVYYDDDRTRAMQLFVKETENALHFSFKAYAKDKTYANYTTPITRNGESILYFDSRNAAAEIGKTWLNRGEFASDKDYKDINLLVEQEILYERDKRMAPDFVIDIFSRQGSQFLEKQDFGIRFNTRLSFLKYHLIGNMNRNDPVIVDLDNQIEFEFCGEIMLQENKSAKVFRSKALVPILEKSNYRFQLKEHGQGSGKVLIKRLPVPSEKRLGMEVINDKSEIVSESYINY